MYISSIIWFLTVWGYFYLDQFSADTWWKGPFDITCTMLIMGSTIMFTVKLAEKLSDRGF